MSELIFEKIGLLKNTVIRYPQFEEAFQQIERILKLKRSTAIAQNLLCLGTSGTGKSTLKREIEKKYPSSKFGDEPQIPILIVDTPAIPTVKNLAEAVLLTLGDPLADKGSVTHKAKRILHFIKECHVELMIFDELQHFIDQGKKNTPYQVSDWLKDLVDQANIPTVLMGLERSEQILKVNEQLRRRFNQRINLKPFNIKDSNDFKVFAGVVLKLQELLDYPMEFDIRNSQSLERIHYATNGVIDYIVKIMLGAYEKALISGEIAITQKSFYNAFIETIWIDAPDNLNPFHKNFIWEPLTKSNMPFHVSGGYSEIRK